MADGEEKSGDFYAVMGLQKECSSLELRSAYKKLAMKWHPDRCAASSSTKKKQDAKNRFQEIQEAYSVLSDSNKRFLYDVGIYDDDDDDNNDDMGDFLGEMAAMMSQSTPDEQKQESFEDLQVLFNELFNVESNGSFGSTGTNTSDEYDLNSSPTSSSSNGANSSPSPCNDGSPSNLKRDNVDMTSGKPSVFCNGSTQFSSGDSSTTFCFGTSDSGSSSGRGRNGGGCGNSGSQRRSGRKQKTSSRHDVSSWDAGGGSSGSSS